MKQKKRNIKNFIQWILACIVAFVLANALILPYWYAPGWIPRAGCSTSAIYHAGEFVINGYEGYGYSHVDFRGYLNEDLPVAQDHVLVLGCSHTKGTEVPMGKRFSSLLNDKLSGGDDSILYAYNLSIDGFYFPAIVHGFKAAIDEMATTNAVVIEIPTTEFSPEEFEGKYYPKHYDYTQTGSWLYYSLPTKTRVQIRLKEVLPLVSLYLSKQLVFEQDSKKPFIYEVPEPVEEEALDFTKEEYQTAIDNALFSICFFWDEDLIIYYHPEATISEDGSLKVKESITTPWFKEVCEKYNVTFVDATEAFLEAYEQDYIVPYGFSNTAPGEGHLNEDGHRISAELIYEALKGGNEE